jgi:thiol:disulfide interchange protein
VHLPRVPITAAIVGGAETAAQSGSARAALLAATLAHAHVRRRLALVYSLLGLFAGLTGTLFGNE